MGPRRDVLFVVLVITLAPAGLHADRFRIIGPRALALGGAFVAKVDDSSAVYWNPAALAFNEGGERGVGVTVGTGYNTYGDLIGKLDSLIELDPKGIYAAAASTEALLNYDLSYITDFIERLGEFDKKTGFGLVADGGAFLAIHRFGVGIVIQGDIGAGPYIDLQNTGLVDANNAGGRAYILALAGTEPRQGADFFSQNEYQELRSRIVNEYSEWNEINSFTSNPFVDDYLNRMGYHYKQRGIPRSTPDIDNAIYTLAIAPMNTNPLSENQTGARIRGYTAVEFPLAAGIRLTDFLALGAALKIIQGWAVDEIVRVSDLVKGRDVEKLVEMFKGHPSTNMSVDLGIMAQFPMINLGFVAKDVNAPNIKTANGGSIEIQPKLRAGFNFHLLKVLSFSFDADILPTKSTFNPEVENQEIAAGVEANIKVLQIRAGYRRDLKNSAPGNVYFAGLGLSLLFLKFDMAVTVSSFSSFLDKRVPNESKIEGGLSVYF